jgi:polar amino acid transport system permease protein
MAVAAGLHGLWDAISPNFDWHVFAGRAFDPNGVFFGALWRTVYIAVAAQVLGVLLGLALALMRTSRLWPFRALSGFYVLVFRGTPVIVQIFFIYFGTSLLFGVDLFPDEVGWLGGLSGAVLAGIVALALNEGAYMREIIRAGIDAVDRGQLEAARSLGMVHGLAMRRIVLPQAARVIVPPLGNEFNNMMKTTSLLFFIGVYEIFGDADIYYSNSFKPAEAFAAVAIWYLVLTGLWSIVQAQIERKLAASERGDELTFRERLARIWSPVEAWGRGAR